jgi:aspartyl-tRNA(Asn)/glutamyl-tRNA(Gln) amidotransferase subunit A
VVFAKDYLKAMRIRTPAGRAIDDFFVREGFDALAHPTRGTVAFPIGRKFSEAYSDAPGGGEPIGAAANLLGLPGIALPNGFGRDHLPTSLSLTGRAWSEVKLVSFGMQYQERTDFHARRPPGFG